MCTADAYKVVAVIFVDFHRLTVNEHGLNIVAGVGRYLIRQVLALRSHHTARGNGAAVRLDDGDGNVVHGRVVRKRVVAGIEICGRFAQTPLGLERAARLDILDSRACDMYRAVCVRPATQSVAIFIDVGEGDSAAVVFKNAFHLGAAVAVERCVADLHSAFVHDDRAAGRANPCVCADV